VPCLGTPCSQALAAPSPQLAVEDDVYDEMDESSYADHVAKRRADDFIEDDKGTGDYVDNGQEDSDEAYSGDEGEGGPRRAQKKAGDKGRGLFNNLAPKAKNKATERVNGMLLGAGKNREVLGAKQLSNEATRLLSSLMRDY